MCNVIAKSDSKQHDTRNNIAYCFERYGPRGILAVRRLNNFDPTCMHLECSRERDRGQSRSFSVSDVLKHDETERERARARESVWCKKRTWQLHTLKYKLSVRTTVALSV